jgi:hypothetical protein
MTEVPYIRDEDKIEYRKFCIHHLGSFGRQPVEEVWHYTTAEGLIGILNSGRLSATHVMCLNDSLEQRYFGDLIHDAVKAKLAAITNDPKLALLFRTADEGLSKRDFSTASRFVTCFTEVEDDLGQWRGYGGGECGYAIGFRFQGLRDAIKPRGYLLPMNYEDKGHHFLVDEVLRMAHVYFLDGLRRGLPDHERWAREFLTAFSNELDIFASLLKHPKFTGEREWRITATLQMGEHKALEFRQKRTLLARYLPIDLTADSEGSRKLPITRVYVGPGPAQRVSQVGVGDLLLKYDYKDIRVELSKVPYRVP